MVIIIYPGRFQPFHSGHYETYKHIEKIFKNNTIVLATSDKVDVNESPFNFKEKKLIINTMFPDIKNIVKTTQPYIPKEIYEKYNCDVNNDSVVFVLGKKDAERLSHSKYFIEINKDNNLNNLNSIKKNGYLYIMPFAPHVKINGHIISGKQVRDSFKMNVDIKEKEKMFKIIYDGKFNQKIFDLLNETINRDTIDELTTSANIAIAPSKYAFAKNPNIYRKYFLNEGGAYGHLNHLYDDDSLTFTDLKNIVNISLQGKLTFENNAQIKTDGQNLMISYKNGKLIYARNKSMLKNFGENAIDLSGIKALFSGRGDIEYSFSTAVKNLSEYFANLNEEDLKEYFNEGKNFASIEIIYPKTKNVIDYGFSSIIFHTLLTYDENGNAIGENRELARKLEKELIEVNKNNFKEFEIKELPTAFIEKDSNFEKNKDIFIKAINSIKNKYPNLSDNSTIYQFKLEAIKKIIEKRLSKLVDNETFDKTKLINEISKRIISDKKENISIFINNNLNKDNISEINYNILKNEIKTINNESNNIIKEAIYPLELIVFKLSVEVLKNLKNYLVANPSETLKNIKQEIQDTINKVKNTNNPEIIKKVNLILNKVKTIKGGFNNIIPEEGITFVYNGKLYKLTGMFAPINQLLGIFKYGNISNNNISEITDMTKDLVPNYLYFNLSLKQIKNINVLDLSKVRFYNNVNMINTKHLEYFSIILRIKYSKENFKYNSKYDFYTCKLNKLNKSQLEIYLNNKRKWISFKTAFGEV